MKRRIYNTYLGVVENADALLSEKDENTHGYWDENGKDLSISVSIHESESIIYLYAPKLWYRTYAIHIPMNEYKIVWGLIEEVIKLDCGRRVLVDGEAPNYITVSKLNTEQAKQIYYLFKHRLTRLHLNFTFTWTLNLNERPTGDPIRFDIKEPRHKSKSKSTTPPLAPTWVEVVGARTKKSTHVHN